MADWRAPGAVVVVIDGGEVVHGHAYGLANVESGELVDVDRTGFRLASISKPLTSIAVMKLYQLGRLDLHADVHRYLGDLRLPGPGTLTAAHLLTHTGGFEDRFLTRLTRSAADLPSLRDYLARDMPPRRYPPGEISLYSNHGMALAGLLVEQVSERPFGEAMEQLIFAPLGMSRSSFDPATAEDLAQGYRFGQPVRLQGIKTVPSSMLVSTGTDMARLMEALLLPTRSRLLDPETVELMLTRHFQHHESFTGRSYGWSEDSSVTPRRLLHSGGTDGFSSGLVLVPERRGGVFVAFNGNADVWELIRDILQQRFPGGETERAASREHAHTALPGRYAPAELPQSSMDKARLLFEQVVVRRVEHDSVRYGDTVYHRQRDGSYLGDSDHTVLFKRGQAGDGYLLAQSGALVRLPWHAAWPLHLSALVLYCIVFVLATMAPRRWLTRSEANSLVHLALRGASALNLIFVVGTGTLIGVAMSENGGVLRYEIPWYLKTLLALPPIALVVTLAALALRLGRGRATGTPGMGITEGLIVAALLGFAPFLAYWKLLGFHF